MLNTPSSTGYFIPRPRSAISVGFLLHTPVTSITWMLSSFPWAQVTDIELPRSPKVMDIISTTVLIDTTTLEIRICLMRYPTNLMHVWAIKQLFLIISLRLIISISKTTLLEKFWAWVVL